MFAQLFYFIRLIWFTGWRFGAIACFLWLAGTGEVRSQPLRVVLSAGGTSVTVGSSSEAIVRDESGQALARLAGMSGFTATATSGAVQLDRLHSQTLVIEPTGSGFVFVGDRWYRGALKLLVTGQQLQAINLVDLDDYLYSVVGAEVYSSWGQEALKAQAVAARTYALYQAQKRRTTTYDLGSDTSWQVYRGVETEADSIRLAVDATQDQVLQYQGQLIEAVFHASAGGHTENSEDVWSEARPYLRGVPAYDRDAPNSQWQVTIDTYTLADLAGGTVRSIQPSQLTPGGRVARLTVSGDASRTLSGNQLRSAFDLPSTMFQISQNRDQFILTGWGRGHGVGMSQWGASSLADRGYHYSQILAHYYQGSQLKHQN